MPRQQYSFNLTSVQLTPVSCPGCLPLMYLPGGEEVVNIYSWIPVLNRWLCLGAQGRQFDGFTYQIDFRDYAYLSQLVEGGMSLAQAVGVLFPGV